MGEFNSDDHYIYYCGQESLRRNRVAIIVNKRIQNAVLGCNLKNDRMISVCFQGKPFSITVFQVYASTTNGKEAEIEQFYEDLQDLLELTPKKRCPFHHSGLECKSRNSRDTLDAVLGCNLKNGRMISVHFQGKPFNITVIQVYAQPVTLKKLKLNSSMKTYKTF